MTTAALHPEQNRVDCSKFGELMTCEIAQALVDEYKSAPTQAEASRHAFDQLLAYSQEYNPAPITVETVSGVPYHTYEEMVLDVAILDRYKAGLPEDWQHPFWSCEDMADYITWHDIDGHLNICADFTPEGESEVFAHHARELLSKGMAGAVDALALEVLYRIAWICTEGWTWEYKPVLPGTLGKNLINQLVRDV